jgi:hypothetical protein
LMALLVKGRWAEGPAWCLRRRCSGVPLTSVAASSSSPFWKGRKIFLPRLWGVCQ